MIFQVIVISSIIFVALALTWKIAYSNGYTHGKYEGAFQKEVDFRKKFNLKDEDLI